MMVRFLKQYEKDFVMNRENENGGGNQSRQKNQNTAAPAEQNRNLHEAMQKAEEQQAGHAQVDTGITETDRNNFDEEHHQDTKKGAGHI